jgi:tetratricopeptide (TPR) repeat protein
MSDKPHRPVVNKVEAEKAVVAEHIDQVVIYKGTKPTTDYTSWPSEWRTKLEEMPASDFQHFCMDLLQAEKYDLEFCDTGVAAEDPLILARKQKELKDVTWLVKCVHKKPYKPISREDVSLLCQDLGERYEELDEELAVDGYWLITGGSFSRGVNAVLDSLPQGKRGRPWGFSKLVEVLGRHPGLIAKYTGVKQPAEDRSELTRYYELLDDELFDQEHPASAERYYKGDMHGWGVIQQQLDVRRNVHLVGEGRLDYERLCQIILDLSAKKQPSLSFVLLTAEAGSGKTTLLFRIGYSLYRKQREYDRYRILRLKGNAPFHLDSLVRFQQDSGKHLYVLVDIYNVHRYKEDLEGVTRELSTRNIPVTIIAAARYNEWNHIGGWQIIKAQKTFDVELGRLNRRETENLLDLLQAHGQLGELTDLTREQQVHKFLASSGADKQLLVALLEATHGDEFGNILMSEYNNLQPKVAQKAYRFVCLCYAYGILLPMDLLRRILELNEPLAFHDQVLWPAQMVILEEYDFDETRCVRARHRRIAEVLKQRLRKLNDHSYLSQMLLSIIGQVDEYETTERYVLLKLLRGLATDADHRSGKEVVGKILEHGADGKIAKMRFQAKEVEERYAELAEWGRLYYEVSDWCGDHDYLIDALEIAPPSTEAAELHYYLGMVLEKLGNEADARHHFDRAFQLNLGSVEFLHHYLFFEKKSGHLMRAAELLKATLASRQDNNRIRRLAHQLLESLMADEEYDEVIGICETSLQAGNDRIRTRLKLGVALEARSRPGDAEAALKHYREIIKRQSDHAMALKRCIALLIKSSPEHYAEAETCYKQAIKAHRRKDIVWAQLRNDYALLLIRIGMALKRGASLLFDLSPDDHSDADLLEGMGRSYYDRAERMWLEVIKGYPEFVWAHLELADFYLRRLGKPKEARCCLQTFAIVAKKARLALDDKQTRERIRRLLDLTQ